jgi:long-chain acyl-CoA synthetase
VYYDPKVRSLILKDLQSTGKRSGLAGMEIVSGVVITDEEWTPPSVSLKQPRAI